MEQNRRQPYHYNHFVPHLSFVNTDSNDSNPNLTGVEFDHSGLVFGQMSLAPANSTVKELLFTTFTEAEIDDVLTQHQVESVSVASSVSSISNLVSESINSSVPVKRGRKPDSAEVKAAKEAKKLAAKEAKMQDSQAKKRAKLT